MRFRRRVLVGLLAAASAVVIVPVLPAAPAHAAPASWIPGTSQMIDQCGSMTSDFLPGGIQRRICIEVEGDADSARYRPIVFVHRYIGSQNPTVQARAIGYKTYGDASSYQYSWDCPPITVTDSQLRACVGGWQTGRRSVYIAASYVAVNGVWSEWLSRDFWYWAYCGARPLAEGGGTWDLKALGPIKINLTNPNLLPVGAVITVYGDARDMGVAPHGHRTEEWQTTRTTVGAVPVKYRKPQAYRLNLTWQSLDC